MNKTVSLVYRLNNDFSDELVFSGDILPMAKTHAERWCKSHNVKILKKRAKDFDYPSIDTKNAVTWLVSPFRFSSEL